MSSALNRMIGDDSHEAVLGGYWVFIRRILWVGVPLLMIFGGIALNLSKVWIAIIIGGSLGPLVALERRFVEWGVKRASRESNKASTARAEMGKQ